MNVLGNAYSHGEGLKTARLLMVLSSISPLFLLWGIRGNRLVCDRYLLPFCAAMLIIPNLFLWLRIRVAIKLQERRELVIGSAEDHRDHILVYLFAMLLPLYPIDMGTWRDFAALLSALAFIVFLFWHLNLHYMNLLFAIFGYRVFTISTPKDDNPLSGRVTQVLLTPRISLEQGEHVIAYRLSDTVYFEVKK
jgi:hypothetical protein